MIIHGTQKKKFPKKLIIITILCAVLVLAISVCLILCNSYNAKKVYTSLLKDLSDEMKKAVTILPEDPSKMQKLTVKNKSVTVWDDDTPSYYDDVAGKTVEEEENYEVRAKDGKYFIKADNFKALWDKENSEIYAVKMEDGKEDGDVLTWKKDDDNSYEAYSLQYRINQYLEYLPDGNSSATSQKDAIELCTLILDTTAKNLKNDYFIDHKNHGVNEYTLSMNHEQLAELAQNVSQDLMKEEKVLKLLKDLNTSEEDFKERIDEWIQDIKDMKDLKITISLFARGKLKNLVGFKMELVTKEGTFVIDLNSESEDVLEKAKELKGRFSLKADDEDYTGNLEVTSKGILATLDMEYEPLDYSSLFSGKKVEKVKNNFKMELKTADEKDFDKTSHVTFDIVSNAGGNQEKIHMVIKGNEEKPFIDCSKITAKLSANDKDFGEVMKLSTLDDKPFGDTIGMELAIKVDTDELKIVLKSMDEKKLAQSSEIHMQATEKAETITLFELKANDGKPFDKTTDFTYTIPMEDIEFGMKTNDAKPFNKSTQIEAYYKGELDYDDVNMRINIETDKELLKANKLTLILKGTIDDEEIDMTIRLDGNKELLKANSISFTLEGKMEDEEAKISGKIETLDKKPLIEGSKFKGTIDCKVGENAVKGNYDANKGYDVEITSHYKSSYSTNDSQTSMKYELVKPENLENLIKIKKAVVADDVDDILDIIQK